MRPYLSTLVLTFLSLLAAGCSTITLAVATDQATADAGSGRGHHHDRPDRPAAGRGDDQAGEEEEGDDCEECEAGEKCEAGAECEECEECDDDDEQESNGEEPRIIEVRRPMRLLLRGGDARQLVLRRTDEGTIIEIAPRPAPCIL